MTEKSHVTLEQQACLVCGQAFDTGSLLLDRRLRPRFEHKTCTGWGLCPEHQKRHDEGYIALVCVDPKKSVALDDAAKVWRTGAVAHVRRSVAQRILTGISDKDLERPMVFCEPEVIEKLEAMSKGAD